MRTDAYLSEDRRYRYWLLRQWDDSLPILALIGANPSKADEKTNDHTIRKEIGFGSRLGFGGIIKVNVGAFRATKPRDWYRAPDPIGSENSAEHIAHYIAQFGATQTIAAWGRVGGYFIGRCEAIMREIPELYCFGKNGDGTPKHPLTLPYSTQIERFTTKEQP